MKKLLCTSVAGLLIGNALPAFAASTTELTVTGLITPSACTPTLSVARIDLGRISVKDLEQDTQTRLPPVPVQLSIDCEASTLFALQPTDNRADSGMGVAEYGLGKTSSDQRIGGYFMTLDKGVADETPVGLIFSMNNGAIWGDQFNDDAWQTDAIVSIRDNAAQRVPVAAKNTRIEVTVNPYIMPAKTVTINEDTLLDGSVTIDVKYL